MDASDDEGDTNMLREEQERELEEQMERDQQQELEREREQAAAAGPSSSRAGPSSDNGDRVYPDWLDQSEGEPSPRSARSSPQRGAMGDGGSRTEVSPAPSSASQGRSAADNDAGTSVYNSRTLHKQLDDIPGFSPMMMGSGISSLPPVFNTGMPGYWVPFSSTGPFPPGVKCRPARVIDLGFVAAWQQASDAERISDMTAQTDPVARARTVATCALMGLLSVGMAKGYVASPNHSELATRLRQRDPEELSKEEKRLDGKVKTYTYCPNATSTEPGGVRWRRR